jgi:hypothetical protein
MAEKTGSAAEVKPNSPMNRPEPNMPEITLMVRLRHMLATPIYFIALIFGLLSELFTWIAERIDG